MFRLLARLEQELQELQQGVLVVVDLHLPFVVEMVVAELVVAIEQIFLGDLVEVLIEAGVDVFRFVPDNGGYDWIQRAD